MSAGAEGTECVLVQISGALMGVGGFARVYRATWNGTPVAVKVILHRTGSVEASVRSEAMLSIMLRHPHLVQGYHYATRSVDSEPDNTSKVSLTIVRLSEPCLFF